MFYNTHSEIKMKQYGDGFCNINASETKIVPIYVFVIACNVRL